MRNQLHTNNINTSQNINKNTDIISTLIHEYLYNLLYLNTDNFNTHNYLVWGLGMGIGDWGLGIGPNPQSPIPNPQSPIPKII